MEQIRYAIADDHPVFISGLVTNLNRYQDLTFVFAAKDGDELIYKLKFKENHVDVILLDIKMPKMSGLAALQTIRQNDPTVRIIILTGTEDDSYIFKMIEEKANSYLIKNSETSEIYQAIINCMELGFYFPEYVKDALLNKEVRKNRLNPKESKQYIELTLREKEVLKLIFEEKNSMEIGQLLHISERTVDGVKAKLLEKTQTRNMVGLVLFCYRNELVNLF